MYKLYVIVVNNSYSEPDICTICMHLLYVLDIYTGCMYWLNVQVVWPINMY